MRQGELGNCWFLSAISALAEYPVRVERLFRNSHSGPNEFGIYGVNICKNGQWTDIVIDDWIPVRDGEPVFSRAQGSELWVLLLEKAWAKLHGSYHSIENGLAITALRDLTGAPCFLYKIAKEDKQKLWEMMCHGDLKQ